MRTTTILAALALCSATSGQETERAIREGNTAYKKGDPATAIRSYQRAQADQRGTFNLGNAYYRQDSVADAQRAFEAASAMAKTPAEQARAFHNLGNSWSRQRKWQEAVNAYKQALKRAPDDDETRYNLAYAQKKLQEEQQRNKDKKDEKQDQKDQQQPDQGKDQPKDQQDQQAQDKPGQGKEPQQDRKDQIGPEDAQRMLDAMQQMEKNTQQKAREKMRVRTKVPIEKDW